VLPAFLLGASLERDSGSAQEPCPVGGPPEVHYAPGEDLERIDVGLLREAQRQIDIAAYALTDRAVIEALREAPGRGVKVRIWRDANMAVRTGPRPRRPLEGARRRAHASQGLLCRQPAPAHRLGQFQPVRRDAPG
jgi:phosphatidylserine/phosphatidylglycerophosphate/cardiolipin synthase-like enzyme